MKRFYVTLFWPAALLGLFWGTTPLTDGLRSVPVPGEPSAKEQAEVVCTELQLTPAAPRSELRLPGFDPALGSLQAVTLRSESTLAAQVELRDPRHPDQRLLFSSGLTYRLPNGQAEELELRLDEQYSFRTAERASAGIQWHASQQTDARVSVESGLEAFVGTGDLVVPVAAKRLIHFKGDGTRYYTDMTVRLCFEYDYETR